jgi:APA family basic amino acid/polyamine antiporter
MKFGPGTAIAVIMANMIGTGVFTSLGYQLLDIQSPFVLLMLWVVGGIAALCGALSYAELGAALPRSGGEYNFLARIFHPGVGFVSGWISATIGFAAPSALAAITFGSYLSSVFPGLSPTWLACGLIVLLTTAHGSSRRSSALVQQAFTLAKVLLIAAFCGLAAWLVPEPQDIDLWPDKGDAAQLTSGAFAVSLIYVSYAFTRLERGHLAHRRARTAAANPVKGTTGRNRRSHRLIPATECHLSLGRTDGGHGGKTGNRLHRRPVRVRS